LHSGTLHGKAVWQGDTTHVTRRTAGPPVSTGKEKLGIGRRQEHPVKKLLQNERVIFTCCKLAVLSDFANALLVHFTQALATW